MTTNDDATNIFLSLYCRRLSDDAHIVSRISHDWNLEAIHRAGADFALSRDSLAVQTLMSIICDRELVVIGEGTELFVEPIPGYFDGQAPRGKRDRGADGAQRDGIRVGNAFTANPTGDTQLVDGGELVMLGSAEQRQKFAALAS